MVADMFAGRIPDKMVPRMCPGYLVDNGALVLMIAFVLVAVQLAIAVFLQVFLVIIFDQKPPLVLAHHPLLKPQADIPRLSLIHISEPTRPY